MELMLKHSIFAVGAGLLVRAVVVIWGKKKRWVKVGTVEKLYIFPLKSGALIESDKL